MLVVMSFSLWLFVADLLESRGFKSLSLYQGSFTVMKPEANAVSQALTNTCISSLVQNCSSGGAIDVFHKLSYLAMSSLDHLNVLPFHAIGLPCCKFTCIYEIGYLGRVGFGYRAKDFGIHAKHQRQLCGQSEHRCALANGCYSA
jgi:hypothetical protein